MAVHALESNEIVSNIILEQIWKALANILDFKGLRIAVLNFTFQESENMVSE